MPSALDNSEGFQIDGRVPGLGIPKLPRKICNRVEFPNLIQLHKASTDRRARSIGVKLKGLLKIWLDQARRGGKRLLKPFKSLLLRFAP